MSPLLTCFVVTANRGLIDLSYSKLQYKKMLLLSPVSPVFSTPKMQANISRDGYSQPNSFPSCHALSSYIGLRPVIYAQEMKNMTSCLCVYVCVISLI